jgi:hypothetical protein
MDTICAEPCNMMFSKRAYALGWYFFRNVPPRLTRLSLTNERLPTEIWDIIKAVPALETLLICAQTIGELASPLQPLYLPHLTHLAVYQNYPDVISMFAPSVRTPQLARVSLAQRQLRLFTQPSLSILATVTALTLWNMVTEVDDIIVLAGSPKTLPHLEILQIGRGSTQYAAFDRLAELTTAETPIWPHLNTVRLYGKTLLSDPGEPFAFVRFLEARQAVRMAEARSNLSLHPVASNTSALLQVPPFIMLFEAVQGGPEWAISQIHHLIARTSENPGN